MTSVLSVHTGCLKALANEKIEGVGALDTRYMYEAAMMCFLLPFLGAAILFGPLNILPTGKQKL